ncbi:tyrosyl-tRNA synthetase [Methylacidimicrobium cyclopophantes]|uniref:Tyrosine--tRNA ligase n=1 Tax=Methylacidimicrobium cyclopophantes TaxID=1041766 RepID=A0A5E6MH48_9BACT|nr:tyrosine--tRNA ligase [Methylacidimicrobium cyclopophantes]VVM08433.1 tyrosyl-tRNA synthetase [Methylacidimicrobium cyclopophantes]
MGVDQALSLLLRGAEQVHSLHELRERLAACRPLRVKFGVDPTSPDLHLGHSVPLFKLRQFQDLGHQAVLVIGDFTAQIGDPTGRNAARPEVSEEEVRRNAATYRDQAFRILDPERVEIVWNASWFGKMSSRELLLLQRRATATQILQRRDFQQRWEKGEPIGLHELLYPLLQGWDSVMVRADVEIGGSDQLFNMLIGRDLQEQVEQPPQVVLTLPLLEGIDGENKMSKSLGNAIGVSEPPDAIFGKTMSISDELMAKWYPIFLDAPLAPELHPMEAKKALAERLVARFHGEEAAKKARKAFERVFSQREVPEEVPEFALPGHEIPILEALLLIGAVPSKSEARRLLTQGAVLVDGLRITDPRAIVSLGAHPLLRCGRRFFARLKPERG